MLGEEIGGDLQSTELEEEVPQLVGCGGFIGLFRGGGSAAASHCLLEAGAENRQKRHKGINRRDWPARITKRICFVQLFYPSTWPGSRPVVASLSRSPSVSSALYILCTYGIITKLSSCKRYARMALGVGAGAGFSWPFSFLKFVICLSFSL